MMLRTATRTGHAFCCASRVARPTRSVSALSTPLSSRQGHAPTAALHGQATRLAAAVADTSVPRPSKRRLSQLSPVQLLRQARHARGYASRAGPSNIMSGQWSIRSPRQLYDHLSQYIIGQERAKRILSVAVFNHYLRITPPQSPLASDPSSTATLDRTSPSIPEKQPSSFSSYASTGPASATSHPGSLSASPPPFPTHYSQPLQLSPTRASRRSGQDRDDIHLDPSRAGAELEDGTRRDLTRAVGANGDGADPTLTHDLLDSRSREGIWARDGFFSSSRPGADRDRPRRRRSSQPLTAPPPDSASSRQNARRNETEDDIRVETAKRNAELEEGFLATSSSRPGRTRQEDGSTEGRRSLDDVVVEKSNVLMIGPTGTGKTLMAKTLAKVLDVPFASCDATTYTQAGYVGDDVDNCVLRLLQNADFDVSRAEVGIIHIDEVDKLARRGGGEYGSWGGGRDVGGEGVQQSLLRLLEGTTLTLQAKPPANWTPSPSSPAGGSTTTGPGPWPSGSSPNSGSSFSRDGPASASRGFSDDASMPSMAGMAGVVAMPSKGTVGSTGGPPEWDPNNPMNRGFGASGKKGVREGLPGFGGGGGGGSAGKTETFVVDTSNILFVLSGAFVGLESIVQRRLGRGSIGFGAPLPKHVAQPDIIESTALPDTVPLKGLATADLVAYGLIPEFLGRLPVLSTLHPLSVEDLVRILDEPKNALIKQYQAQFEKIGAELQFTDGAIQEIARIGLKRGGGARGLRGILEEVLLDAMYDAPGSSIRYVLISESVIKATEPAHYFSRGQRVQFVNMLREENDRLASKDGHRGNVEGEDGRIQGAEEGYAEGEEEEGGADLRAYG